MQELWTAQRIRETFLRFYKERGHTILPSASLVPENDPTVLFTTAGMHPLVPYLLGERHPGGTRLANVQKCVRTQDIDEVGDNRHDTFFEMLGNWSLGDYFKRETIQWSFQLLTGREWFGIAPERLCVTVFTGDDDAPRDEESIRTWQECFQSVGVTANVAPPGHPDIASGARIYQYGKSKNWWGPAGQTGPCGPDTEMFVDLGTPHDLAFGPACHPNCDCGRFLEVWNDVFMEFEKRADGTFAPLAQKNVDTGMGLERMALVLQEKPTIFETDLFVPLMEWIAREASQREARAERIVADHVRTACFMLSDGVTPSNADRGYILRRIVRRAIRYGRTLGFGSNRLTDLLDIVIREYAAAYPNLTTMHETILMEFRQEEEKFERTVERGLKEFERIAAAATEGRIGGSDAFDLFQSYGFPLEMTVELGRERGLSVDTVGFDIAFAAHQQQSRAATGSFKGGLADHSDATTRLHTATHLLHRALKNVLGEHVTQKGSNITAERLRFDFSHPEKMTAAQVCAVEDMVNDAIAHDLSVAWMEMTTDEAKATGAMGYFEDKYAQLGGKIKVYVVGDDVRGYFSKEICGGPHVARTGMLGRFRIIKEEAVSQGVRRMKASVEPPPGGIEVAGSRTA
ncbi:MAG: alanine--tRNA ligase [bacterium]|nr:alanine--tRNA ligase [bacterium]